MQQTLSGYQLSPQQERLWLLQQQSDVYSAYCSLLIEGKLHIATLQKTLETILLRNEIYRTCFRRLPGVKLPIQIINERPLSSWLYVDLNSVSSQEQQREVAEFSQVVRMRSIDVKQGPLFYCTLLALGAQRHLLFISLCPLHADTQTIQHLLQEITQFYSIPTPPMDQDNSPIQYIQFSEWQNQLLEENKDASVREYWRSKNIAAFASKILPLKCQVYEQDSFLPDFLTISIEPLLRTNIDAVLAIQQATTSAFFLTCWIALLRRLIGEGEFMLGLCTEGRIYEELATVPGLIAKYMPFLCQFTEHWTFEQILTHVKEVSAKLLDQQSLFTWEDLIQPAEPAAPVLYPFSFEVREHPDPCVSGNISFTLKQCYTCYEPFYVKLVVVKSSTDLKLEFHYHAGLFEQQDVRRLAERFIALVEDASRRLDAPIRELTILGLAEQELLLVTLNQTRVSSVQDVCIHQLFERQVDRTPDAIAVTSGDAQLTYHALNIRAIQLANHLQKNLRIQPEGLIGIYLERSLELIISILGILKAGGAYVPLDPAYPKERLEGIAKDACLRALLTRQQFQERVLPASEVIFLDTAWGIIEQQGEDGVVSGVEPAHLAYVIYTSGSTGQPKGVMVPHKAIAHYISWCSQRYEVEVGSGAPVHSSLAFDLTLTSLFAPLVVGRRVVLLPENQNIETLGAVLNQGEGFSLLKITPAHLDVLKQYLHPHKLTEAVRTLVIGGEALRGENLVFWRQHAPAIALINEYGPTETVVGCCVYELPPESPVVGNIPIGRPIPGAQVYVLDPWLQPVPLGVVGEIYIGGIGLGRGYLNRADLTAERFLPNPFEVNMQPGARMYKTGDLARYISSEGNLDYLGRIDRQVKIRGFRVELGEIEALLEQHPLVNECVVLAREESPDRKYLVAYVVPDEQASLSAEQLGHYLREKVPEYLLPSKYVILNELPLTPNGKVDLNLLPLADQWAEQRHANTPRDINAKVPRDVLEFQLLQIWEELLQIQGITITDNFFDLGGHSILAVSLMARLHKQFGLDLPLAVLFEHKSVAELAVVLRQQTQTISPLLIAIQPNGTKLPFVCVHPAGGTVFCYTNLARHLGSDQPFYGLQAPDLDGRGETYNTLEDIVARYISELQTVQPKGPYRLGGWSSGGVVAFEMAQQLLKQGHEVSLIALLDTFLPYGFYHSTASVEPLDTSDAAMVKEIAERKNFPVREDLYLLEPAEQLRWVLEQGKEAHFVPEDTDIEQFRRLRRVHLINLYLQKIYVPHVYPGLLHMFRASESVGIVDDSDDIRIVPSLYDPTGGWEKLTTKGVKVYEIPGGHKEMVDEPNVRILASKLKDCLDRDKED